MQVASPAHLGIGVRAAAFMSTRSIGLGRFLGQRRMPVTRPANRRAGVRAGQPEPRVK